MSEYFDIFHVLNASITASWLVVAVLIVRKLFKKAPKWLHVALWGLVALRLILPFSLESVISLIPSAEPIPQKVLQYEGEQRGWPVQLKIVDNPVISEPVTIELNQKAYSVQVKHIYLSLIWWCGMGVMLLYATASFLRLRIKMRTAVWVKENIYQSERVGVPFILGVFMPRIYVPFAINEQEMQHVIAHEKAHIRRKDHWWKPLGFLLLTVHWFNPVIWVAYVFLCRDIELACDEKVIKILDREQRADYSQALLSLGASRKRIAACPLAFGEVGVKERIRNVIYYKKPAFWLVAAALTASTVAAVCFLTNPATGKDYLKVFDCETFLKGNGAIIQKKEDGEICITEFESALGDKVKSGLLYVEQWYNGVCERSVPAIMTENLSYIYIHVTAELDYSEVYISTNEFGGDWTTRFEIPYEETVTDWTFSSAEKGQEINAKAGAESILCSLEYDNGRQILVRAVWSKVPVEKRADETNRFYMKMFQLEGLVELEDSARKAAYISALEQLIYQRIAPDGDACDGVQEFAILDIDRDGEEELIIRQEQTAMAGMYMAVYDYDEETKWLRREFAEFPSVTFYENGVVVANISHNQGPASSSEDFWPYCVYHYSKELDKYEYIAYVEGWLKAPHREFYGDSTFPQEADLDGDGMVYYIMPDGYILENPVDNAAYNAWRESAVGDSEEISFSYQRLPEVRPPAAG